MTDGTTGRPDEILPGIRLGRPVEADHPTSWTTGGRALYEAFIADVSGRGVRRVKAITWPGNRASVGFHQAIGFRIDAGPASQRLYGTPAYVAYDGEGEDRFVFVRDIAPSESNAS